MNPRRLLGPLLVLGLAALVLRAAGTPARHPGSATGDAGPHPTTAATATAGGGVAPPRPPLLPAVARAHAPRPPGTAPASYYTAAQARAYAAAGLAADGHPEALAQLDAAARAELAGMQARLRTQQPLPAAVASAGMPGAAAGAGAGIGHLDLGQADHGIQSGPDGVTITGSEVWALAHLDPSAAHLDIANRSGAAYVVRLFPAAVDTIRLNGGLIVPGRAYAVGASAEITGTAPCAIHIRPLSAVPLAYPAPLLPEGDG